MRFLHEKQTRRFYLFLIIVCICQTCLLGVIGIFQVQEVQRILAERELAAVSYLLEADIPPALIASAWNQRETTEEGELLLQTIGHTEQSQNYLPFRRRLGTICIGSVNLEDVLCIVHSLI